MLPAYEGEMGVLKDHISIISFLKPGIIKVYNSDNKADNFYIEDGIIEFNDNCLTVLTSKISDIISDLKQGESFIAFADLKESDIIGWVKNILGNEYVANVENNIASRINLRKNPPVTAQVKDLPW